MVRKLSYKQMNAARQQGSKNHELEYVGILTMTTTKRKLTPKGAEMVAGFKPKNVGECAMFLLAKLNLGIIDESGMIAKKYLDTQIEEVPAPVESESLQPIMQDAPLSIAEVAAEEPETQDTALDGEEVGELQETPVEPTDNEIKEEAGIKNPFLEKYINRN